MRTQPKPITVETIVRLLDESNVILVLEDGDYEFRYIKDDKRDDLPYSKEIQGPFHLSSYYININNTPYCQCVVTTC